MCALRGDSKFSNLYIGGLFVVSLQITTAAAPIRKERVLKLSRKEGMGVSVCVNGRAGRRVACVLDGEGMELEMFDMEGDEEDEEGETS